SHPLWATAIEDGQVSCFLHSDFLAGALPHGPLVVLDYATDGRLGHDLYAAHYGKLLSCKIAAQQNPAVNNGGQDSKGQGGDAAPTFALHYDWNPADLSGLPQAWQTLLKDYCQTLNSAALLLPTAAMRTVDVLTQHSEGSFLLLHAGCGAIDERDIRLGSFTPPLQVTVGDPTLPVNHHALAAYLYKAGAAIRQEISAGGALTLCVGLRGEPDDQRVLTALMPLLEGAHDPAPLPGNDLPDEVDLQDCLVQLRAAQYDPTVLSALFPQLYAARWALPTLMREQWRAALTRLWCQYLPEADGNPLYRMVAWLAWQLGDYWLARIAYLTGLELYGDNTIDLCELAVCLAETGQIQQALSVLQEAVPQSDEQAAYERLRQDIEARLQSQQEAAWYNPALADIDELRLVPLASHHAAPLLYQFRDPQIATMTALPELASLEDAERWIAAQAVDQRMCCAVMHQDHGFVGLVNLRVARDAGYFYFWMGVDHQGKGYGPRAGQALLQMAQARGITRLFTSAFADNLRSQLALAKLGFTRISAKALPPDEELIFFVLGNNDAGLDQKHCAELQALCRAIDSPFVFTHPNN
ncbi:MAG: GNAT family N-acetyltransferase, partial [Betaproteobacteria bacterium]|nr:GNAT family N-acetyltransferase [Betaproteobacteria bacterium]